MSKKKRLKDDAFSWVADTTQKNTAENAEVQEPDEHPPANRRQPHASAESPRRRSIFVEYVKQDGQIVAIHEMFSKSKEGTGKPRPTVPEGTAVAAITLDGDLLDKKLIEIHQNYKVVITNKKPSLVSRG